MLATVRTSLPEQFLNFQRDFLRALAGGVDLTVQAQDWQVLENEVIHRQQNGLLESKTASIVHDVASNVRIIGQEAMRLQQEYRSMEDLCQEIDGLLISHDSNNLTTSQASTPAKSTTAFPPIPSPPRSPENSLSTEPSALRQWFVTNIFFPYPTPAEKATLAAEANIPIKKISPNLCNLRRRSGWQAFIQKWCGGNRDEAYKLFRRVASGAESRPEVLKEIEDIKEYATRSLVVRDWVPEVARTSTQLKHATYQALSAAPTTPTPTPNKEDINAVERLTPQRSFSNSSTDSADSNTSSATDVSSSVPSTPPSSIVYSSTSNKRSLNPEAGEFVPSAKRVRIRFEITEPEPEPLPLPSSDWAVPGLSQSLWMGGVAREMSPSPSPASQPFTSTAVGWEVPGLPAPEAEATFMSIFGLDTPIDIDDITRSTAPSFNKQ